MKCENGTHSLAMSDDQSFMYCIKAACNYRYDRPSPPAEPKCNCPADYYRLGVHDDAHNDYCPRSKRYRPPTTEPASEGKWTPHEVSINGNDMFGHPTDPKGYSPDTSKVTRFEVIDNTGRVVVRYNVSVELSYQDDGRTLKVFLNERHS